MEHKLELALLGSPQVTFNRNLVTEFKTYKAQGLLYFLAVTRVPNQRATLAALLWGDFAEDKARASLSKALSELRSLVGSHIAVTGQTIAFRKDACYWLDVERLEQGIGEWAVNQDMNRLLEAVDLYRGDFLQGFQVRNAVEFEMWLSSERDRLRTLVVKGLQLSSAGFEEQQEWRQAIDISRRLLTIEPWRESTHRRLMRLYAQTDQQASALRQYEICVNVLEQELGVPPSDETNELLASIRSRKVPTSVNRRQPRQTVDPYSIAPNNLPDQVTTFVGREEELTTIMDRLAEPDCRLLTLVGPGGIGKTRLSIEAAGRITDRYAHGVAYTDLQSLTDVQYLAETIAQSAGLQLSGQIDPTEQLLDYLKEKEILLLLDNFEHLMDGAKLVSDILMTAPNARCLVTSREVLNLHEEWLVPLNGLRLTTDSAVTCQDVQQADAVELFEQRARQVRHDFDLDAEYVNVLKICQLVEGMPLAIELAAPWLRVLSAKSIAEEIEQGLAFLSTRMRNTPLRHRSMYAALEQSWRRLDGTEQQVLSRLSVFRGGFRRSAAEFVAGATLPVLTSLVDCSLLRWEQDGRYSVHELIRQYSAERLAEKNDVQTDTRHSHCEFYADFLSRRTEALGGSRHRELLDEIRVELDNVRVAIQWGSEQADLNRFDRLAYAFYLYCDTQGLFHENAILLEQTLGRLKEMEQTTAVQQSTAAYLSYLGWCYIRLGRLQESVDRFERSEALYDESGTQPPLQSEAEPLAGMALAHHVLGNYAQALSIAEKAQLSNEAREDEINLMVSHYVLCSIYLALDKLDSARFHGLQAKNIAERHGNNWFLGYVLTELGNIALAQSDLVEAQRFYQESYELKEGVGDPQGMAASLNQLGQVSLLNGHPHEAENFHRRSLAHFERVSDPGGRAITLHGLGNAAAAQHEIVEAIDAYRQALLIYSNIHFWPRNLSLFVDIAALLIDIERRTEAVELLHLVISHPATDGLTQRRAQALLATLSGDSLSWNQRADDTWVPDLDSENTRIMERLAELTAAV